jgi:hypothetical protein
MEMNDDGVDDIYEYVVTFHVRGEGLHGSVTIWATDAEAAVRGVREKIRRDYGPDDVRRRKGIVIDSVREG